MKLSSATLEGFVYTCLRKEFDKAVETPQCHRDWWSDCCSSSRYVAIAAPRSHGKSTAITHSYTLAAVLFRERKYVLIVSSTYAVASQFLHDIKQELSLNEDIRELFEIEELIKEAEDDIIVRFKDGECFRIQARGAEQSLRGVKWDNKRPDLIVCDDMESDEQVMNKDRRAKLKRWFYGALVPLLSRNGIIRVVGTILHLDSMLESLMPESILSTMGEKGRKALIRDPLKEYTELRTSWKSAKYKAHDADFSHILWPEMWPKERLKEYREDFIRQGLTDIYSQEMLNVPLDEARSFFKRNDFFPMNDVDKKRKLNYYIAGDLAISGKQRSDWTVFCIGGMDEDGILHIKNVVRDRMDGMEIVQTILSLQKLYKPILFSLEDGQISKSLLPYLREQMIRTGEFANLKLLKPLQDKITRAQSIQARMRAGGVRFDKSQEWYQTFEDELTRFPRDKHDDQVDAFAYLGMICDTMSDHETEEELEIQEYYDMKKEEVQGRSSVTGY